MLDWILPQVNPGLPVASVNMLAVYTYKAEPNAGGRKMLIQEHQRECLVVQVQEWLVAISDGLCVARYRHGKHSEVFVDLDVNHAATEQDIRNRNGFLHVTDEEVFASIEDGTYTITDLDYWYSSI